MFHSPGSRLQLFVTAEDSRMSHGEPVIVQFLLCDQWRSQKLKFTGARLGHKTISEKLEIMSLPGVHVTSW